jgi:hypothetical protein
MNDGVTARDAVVDADPAPHELLLILQILIGRKQQIVTGLLGCRNEFPILQHAPVEFICRGNIVSGQSTSQGNGDALVKNDLQAATLRAAYSKTTSTCSRDTPGNHSK